MRQIISGRCDSSQIRSYKASVAKKAVPINMPSVGQPRTLKKPKRLRSAFTTDQVNYLEQAYKRYPYIDREGRQHLATVLKLDERPIKIWFQNRRMKEKKEGINRKEFDVEIQINDLQLKRQQLNNVPALQSTNDTRLHSLPTLSPAADSTVYTNTMKENKIEHENKPPTRQLTVNKQTVAISAEQKTSPRKANFYKETNNFEEEITTSPYFSKQQKADSTVPPISDAKRKLSFQENDSANSAEVSINLCKKYKEERVPPEIAVIGSIGKEDQKLKPAQKVQKSPIECKVPKNISPNLGVSGLSGQLNSPFECNVSKNISSNLGVSGHLPPPPKLAANNNVNVNKPVYFPVMPGVYPSPFVAPDGVVWKPVNLMPMMATNGPPMNISNRGPQMPMGNQAPPSLEGIKNCTCNCHCASTLVPMAFPPSFQNPYTQYVLSVPFPHTSPTF